MAKFGIGIVEDAETGHELVAVLQKYWVETKEEARDINFEELSEQIFNELMSAIEDDEEVDAEE